MKVSEIIEQGDIFFFYRPRVGIDQVDDLSDVRNFFMILQPDGAGKYRRIIVGRKRLPDVRDHERNWAFVEEVAETPDELRDDLGREVYETRTRGIRVAPEARPVGEGRYLLARHNDHAHLAYVLEVPKQLGPAQDAFRIRPEASYIVAVRNPHADAPSFTGLRPGQRADYPPDLMERFGDRRFISVDDPRFLDYEGAEIVLIGAAEDVDAELGVEPEIDDEDLDLLQDLDLDPKDPPSEPLERGELR
jgi:hypothetical protein